MSDQPDDLTPRTAREVRIARDAWGAGQLDAACPLPDQSIRGLRAEAARRYPLPTRTRRRRLQDEYDIWWRTRTPEERELQYPAIAWEFQYHGRWVLPVGDEHVIPTERRVAIWADLLATPTEEVPDDQ